VLYWLLFTYVAVRVVELNELTSFTGGILYTLGHGLFERLPFGDVQPGLRAAEAYWIANPLEARESPWQPR
jgi:hypothetical protein